MKNQRSQAEGPRLGTPLHTKVRLASVLLLTTVLLCAACGGRETTATTMKLAGTEGTVSVRDEKQKDLAPAADMNLYSGYQMNTKAASYAWLNLDSARLAKMDQLSALEIQKSGRDLELLLQSGSLYFNIEKPLEDDETMDIRTSSLTVGIRGTCGWVEKTQDGQVNVYILEGKVLCSVEIPGTRDRAQAEVSSGEMAMVDLEKGEIQVEPFPEEAIPSFVSEELSEDDLDTFRPYLATEAETPTTEAATAEEPATTEAAEETPTQIAAQVLGKAEGSDSSFAFRYISTGDYSYGLSGEPRQQLLAADRYDYDGDGEDEILAFVLEGDNEQGFFIRIGMLEKEGDSWTLASFLEPEDPYSGALQSGFELDAATCMGRIDFFARITETGEIWLMQERTCNSTPFADGFFWELTAYRYRDRGWQIAHERMNVAGSSGIDSYRKMDPAAAAQDPESGPEGVQYVQAFVDGVHEMGIYPAKELAVENPIMDDDAGLRKLLRLQTEYQFEAEDYGRLEAGEPAGSMTLTATDFYEEQEP